MERDGVKTPKRYTIAVDFDGTIVEHKYPSIGAERPGAVEAVRKLIQDGHRVILYTVREREFLDEALVWCRERGLSFYAVNKNYPEESTDDLYYSRKLQADLFIDDRMIGGLPDWDVIYQVIAEGRPFDPLHVAHMVTIEHQQMMERYQEGSRKKRGGLFGKIRW